jgi:DNA (cytosine-5)-methyltransferase 1
MAWLYLPEAGDSNSDSLLPSENITDQSPTLKGKQRPLQSWQRTWNEGGWIRLLSGMTLQPSQAMSLAHSWITSTLSQQDSLANRGQSQDSEKEPMTGLLHGGIEYVLGDLASVGFDAEWASIRASDVGAPHRRERVFILGYSNRIRSTSIPGRVENPNNGFGISTHSSIQTRRAAPSNASSSELGIPSSSGRSAGSDREREHEVHQIEVGSAAEDSKLRGVGQSGAGERGKTLAHSVSERGCSGDSRWKDAEHAFPPGPSGDWSNVPERFWPAVKPSVRGMANGMAGGLARNDRLRILGNGVVPQQAALAYTLLTERLNNPK